MKLRDLYERASVLGIEDEETMEVLAFESKIELQQREMAYCGCCKLRKTEECPFPDSSSLGANACLSFDIKTNIKGETAW